MSRFEADDVVRTWYVSFLLAGNFSASSPEEVHAKKAVFARSGFVRGKLELGEFGLEKSGMMVGNSYHHSTFFPLTRGNLRWMDVGVLVTSCLAFVACASYQGSLAVLLE